MKRIKKSLMMACVAAALLASNSLMAQPAPGGGPGGGGGGMGRNFDPEQFRQRMADAMRERLEVTNDDEWKILQERIEKVTTLQRESGGGMFRGMGGMGMMRGPRNNNDAAPAGGGGNRRNFGPEPSPDVAALEKALEGKASTEELKAKLASVRETRKASAAKLEKAQEDLRKLVNVRQEAQLVLMGLLK